jgi:hypothetical protein
MGGSVLQYVDSAGTLPLEEQSLVFAPIAERANTATAA